MTPSDCKQVFVVEDDAITRGLLCARVTSHAGFQIASAVGTVKEIRAALQAATPDVLLVDLELPDGSGIDVISEAAARFPSLPIMVITVFGDERRVISAVKAGASGYLLKDDTSHEIVASIEQLLNGGSPISPGIARHLIRVFKEGRGASDLPSNRPRPIDPLTARELELLGLAAKGFSYAEIAQMLSLTTNTVASYTKRIYEKLAVHSKTEAIYEAARLGLIAPK